MYVESLIIIICHAAGIVWDIYVNIMVTFMHCCKLLSLLLFYLWTLNTSSYPSFDVCLSKLSIYFVPFQWQQQQRLYESDFS